MSCDCQYCEKKEINRRLFSKGSYVYLNRYDFPSSFPDSEKSKSQKIEYFDEVHNRCFFLAGKQYGGKEEKVNNEYKSGFWVDDDNLELAVQQISNGTKIKIIDPDGSYCFHFDVKNEFVILTFETSPTSSYKGCYFIEMEDGSSEFNDIEGEWIKASYIRPISKANQQANDQNVGNMQDQEEKNSTSMQQCFNKAATRSTSRMAIKVIRKGLLRVVQRYYTSQNTDQTVVSSNLKVIEDLLDSQIGQAGLGILAGYLLPKIPGISKNQKVLDVAEEMAVEGMSVGMDQVIDFGIENVIPEILPLLDSLPGAEEIKAMLPPVSFLAKKNTETEKAKPKSKVAPPEEELEEIIVGAKENTTKRKTRAKAKNQ